MECTLEPTHLTRPPRRGGLRLTLPLSYQWSEPEGDRPAPVRLIRPLRPVPPPAPSVGYEWRLRAHVGGGNGVGSFPPLPFHFTHQMTRLCADIAACTPALGHIDARRLLISVTQARTARPHGLQAKVTPLRFRHGSLTERRRGRVFQVQRYVLGGIEVLYLVTFCLPRFLDLPFDEKLVTVVHELYHIAPEFNGDLRRHGGRYCIHTASQKKYDKLMSALVEGYLRGAADPAAYAFLRHDFAQLHARHGGVCGTVVPVPKLVPLRAEQAG